MVNRYLACVVIFASLAGCQSPGEALREQGAVQMSQAEIIELVSGKTEQWENGAGYFDPDGTTHGVWKGEEFDGTWRVTDDGTLCYTVDEWWPNEHCDWIYFSQGDTITTVNTRTNNTTIFNKSSDYKEGDQT